MGVYKMVLNKRFVFDPSDTFVSTYEFTTDTPISSVAGKDLIQAVCLAEAIVLAAQVEFTSGVISTWIADSEPYNPDNLIVKALSGTGLRAAAEDAMADRNLVYKITREPEFGKAGVVNLRGALLDTDVQTEGAHSILVGDSPLNSFDGTAFDEYRTNLFDAFSNASALFCMVGAAQESIFYPATPEGTKQVPVVTYGDPTTRPVVAFGNARIGPLQSKRG